MLARLEAIDGVAGAEVDHRGELLRLTVASPAVLDEALAALHEQGYGAEPLATPPEVARWYGRDGVRELSGEEAAIIARRVVDAFLRARPDAAPRAATVLDTVVRALTTFFVAHTIDRTSVPGALVRDAAAAVESAAHDVLDADAARALAAELRADLERITP